MNTAPTVSSRSSVTALNCRASLSRIGTGPDQLTAAAVDLAVASSR
jgi:hypothetical protein